MPASIKHRLTFDPSGPWFRYLNLVPPGAVVLGTGHLGLTGRPGAVLFYPQRPDHEGCPFTFELWTDGHRPQPMVPRKVLACFKEVPDHAQVVAARAPLLAPYLLGDQPFPTPPKRIRHSNNSPVDPNAPKVRNIKRKLGRKPTIKKPREVLVYLSEETFELAKLLGFGSVSAGVRAALMMYSDKIRKLPPDLIRNHRWVNQEKRNQAELDSTSTPSSESDPS